MQASLWQLSAGITGATGRTWGARLAAGYATSIAVCSAVAVGIVATRPSARSAADAVALQGVGGVALLTALAVAPSLARELASADPALAALARLRGQSAGRVAAARFLAGVRRFAWLLGTRGGVLALLGLAVAGGPPGRRALQLALAGLWLLGVTLCVSLSAWLASALSSERAGRWWIGLWLVPEALRHFDSAVPSAAHALATALDAVIALGAAS